MRFVTLLTIAVLPCVAWAGPHLPWPESYFFPIGTWVMPSNDEEDWLDNDGTHGGKTIDDWDPPDYYYTVYINKSVGNYLHDNLMTRTVYTCFYRENQL
jgi:hypothetical protein